MPWTLDIAAPGLDVESLLGRLGAAALKLAFSNPGGAATELHDAARGLSRSAPSAAQLAAEMWLQTLTLTVGRAAGRAGLPLESRERRKAVADFVRPVWQAADGEEYDSPELVAPETFAPCRALLDALPDFLAGLDPAAPRPEPHALVNDLRQSLDRVGVARWDTYRPVLEPQAGPSAERARRRAAWSRHAAWIRARFETRPLPLREDDLALRDVYVRPRCCRYEEIEAEDGAQDRPKRRAEVGMLHETVAAWLAEAAPRDVARLVCGGPGSGKSSFAAAFATELLEDGARNVAFIELQHLRLRGELRDDLAAHLRKAGDGEGLGFDPLETLESDGKPLLLIFDGLDELARDEAKAEALTRQFVDRAVRMALDARPPAATPVRVLILGRTVAADQARGEAHLPSKVLLHVLKMSPMSLDDLGRHIVELVDPQGLLEEDQRVAEWPRLLRVLPDAPEEPPEAVTDADFEGLNAEPLLLYLLLISGFAGERWAEAKDNRNRVYEAIFRQVYAREAEKRAPRAHELTEPAWFDLMECLGLAAWRGGGRTGSDAEFEGLRDRRHGRRYAEVTAASLKSVATQFYTRADLGERGFEFIHKTFGEYLAARGLCADAARLADRLSEERPEDAAPRWLALTAPAEVTPEILRFLRDEARLAGPERAAALLAPLTELMNWSIAHGFPAHEQPAPDFHAAARAHRHATVALLAALNACVRAATPDEAPPPRLAFDWGGDDLAARRWLTAIGATIGVGCIAEECLTGAELRGATLRWSDLLGADLLGADLSGADLTEADLVDRLQRLEPS